jgi:hypothetical protein
VQSRVERGIAATRDRQATASRQVDVDRLAPDQPAYRLFVDDLIATQPLGPDPVQVAEIRPARQRTGERLDLPALLTQAKLPFQRKLARVVRPLAVLEPQDPFLACAHLAQAIEFQPVLVLRILLNGDAGRE